ncbi:RNA binding [Dermatophagoides pteronyssinus]|uniref:RNA binding n=1 Tax=Dermatophagoides pteronyssinus TaxID=6956 RepID=A0ABQ8ITS7_DERPT|nr:RNA binding [Dermatophagoides pteronyssinus]
MALNDRAVVLACSVSLLAITLATIYYWQSSSLSTKKNRKNSKSSLRKKSNQSVVVVDEENEQSNCIISDNNYQTTKQDQHNQSENIVELKQNFPFVSLNQLDINHLDDKIPCSSTKSVDIGHLLDSDFDSFEINDDDEEEEEDSNLKINDNSDSSISFSFTSIDEDEYIEKKMHLKNYSFNTNNHTNDHDIDIKIDHPNSSNLSFKNCSPKLSSSSSSSPDKDKEIIVIDDDTGVSEIIDEIDGNQNNNDNKDDDKEKIESKNSDETIEPSPKIDSFAHNDNDDDDENVNNSYSKNDIDDKMNQQSSTIVDTVSELKSNENNDDNNNEDEIDNFTTNNNDQNIESNDKINVSSSENSDNDLDKVIADDDGDGDGDVCNLSDNHNDDSATNHQSKDDKNDDKPTMMMTTTTTTVNTSSNSIETMTAVEEPPKSISVQKKDTNSLGPSQQRQTFAQVVSSSAAATKNCDSTTMVANKNDQQSDLEKNCESKIIDESANVKNNVDTNSNSAKIDDENADTQQQSNKDENDDTDIYQNYPDLTLTPNSDQQQQQQVTDPNSSSNSYDDQSQESNDSGKGSCLLETIPTSTAPINDKITEAMAAAENSWYPSTAINNNNIANNSPMPSIFDTIPMDNQHCIQYNFRIPSNLCGFLIGRKGRVINPIKMSTNTQIVIEPYNETTNLCTIYGLRHNVFQALNLIRNRLPEDTYPNVDFNHFPITPTVALSAACQLSLPVGVMTEVILSCTINASHFFLQQPTHPSYPMLSIMDQEMKENYSNVDTPPIPQVKEGLVCAAPTAEGWYRASVKFVHESRQECDLTFVDYGGEALNVPVDTLRAIHYHFLRLPFQASECHLAHVMPIDAEIGWTAQANAFFEELAQGQVIHAFIENFDENGIPCINLFKNGENKTWINIADELVNHGHAQYIVNTPLTTTTATVTTNDISSSSLSTTSMESQPYWSSGR